MKYLLFFSVLSFFACTPIEPPQASGPIPTQQQLNWQKMEFYGFLHFGLNTFTNQEWGYGDTDPEVFNPKDLDPEQWVLTAKNAGMKGLIITAKHHDGFCLWPSQYTEYSVKRAAWKNGQGDVLKELSEACKKHGLKMGVYLSPWDRNHPDYGKPEYITYFRKQLSEVLSNYGPLFEIWFDGANGGDGYYGNANEMRYVDKKSYYDWKNTYSIIRDLQPDAIIWSDAGPDARWVGNEHGFAYETTWSPLLRDSIYGGMPEYAKKYSMGQEKGTHWVPAEADVSIRPGWFFHASEDDKVKSLKQLLDIYYSSVGQNATLLLNLPVNQEGRIPKEDSVQLMKMRRQLQMDLKDDLARNKQATASNTRGNSEKYGASRVLDGDEETFWATDDGLTRASLSIDLEQPTAFNRMVIQEYIPLGQRVKSFSVAVETDGEWQELGSYSTIGYKRILRFPEVLATGIRFTVHDAKACPLIASIEVFQAPLLVDEPIIQRNKEGMVTFVVPEEGASVYYTLDGKDPDLGSLKFEQPFLVALPTTVKAFSYDPDTKTSSETSAKKLEICKRKWKIANQVNQEANRAIDDDPKTEYGTKDKEMVLDLGEVLTVKGFTYTPSQQRWPRGILTHYSLFRSMDNENWQLVKAGELSNISANPVLQRIYFDKALKTRFLKLKAEKIQNDSETFVLAEIGVITK